LRVGFLCSAALNVRSEDHWISTSDVCINPSGSVYQNTFDMVGLTESVSINQRLGKSFIPTGSFSYSLGSARLDYANNCPTVLSSFQQT
jgi:hypothetical protein